MQTFLPYPDFTASAVTLHRSHLNTQRSEALTVLKVLLGEVTGWRNHPVTRMWRGYDGALCLYGIAICDEWIRRGYDDTFRPLFAGHLVYNSRPQTLPHWLGQVDFHESHQSNLVRKKPEHYRRFFPSVDPNRSYVWPKGLW